MRNSHWNVNELDEVADESHDCKAHRDRPTQLEIF